MKVTVSGYYGFANTGDEAIALSISRELRARGHTPLLLSQTPAETAAAYGCASAARMSPPALLRALRGSQALWSGGGGLLQDGTSARTLTYYLTIIRAARLLGRRAVVFNQSVGPLSAVGGARVAAALRGVPIIVRDRASLETLRGLGLQGELGGDPALLLTPGAGVQPGDAVLLAPRGDVQDATAGLRQTVAGLRAAGVRTVALSLHPHVDDGAARSLGADELISTSDPVRALDSIAACRAVVGVRLHAVILAAAAGVPFVGVAYDPKVSGFCTDAGALSLPTSFDAAVLLAALAGGPLTDWDAVAEMKTRAGRSFDLALQYSQR